MTPQILHNPQPGEKVVMVLRRHWLTIFWMLAVSCLLALLPIGIYVLFLVLSPRLLTDPIMSPILAMVGSLYYLALWLFVFTDFIDYYLDVWIITTGRIINIEQHGLFRRTSSELNLSSVQDVTAETKGFLQTLFQFGNVFVQTAGEQQRFQLKNVPDIEQIRETIMQLSEKDRMKELGGNNLKELQGIG